MDGKQGRFRNKDGALLLLALHGFLRFGSLGFGDSSTIRPLFKDLGFNVGHKAKLDLRSVNALNEEDCAIELGVKAAFNKTAGVC